MTDATLAADAPRVFTVTAKVDANTTGTFRWTPGALRTFEREYANRYADDEQVFLDWDVVFVLARTKI